MTKHRMIWLAITIALSALTGLEAREIRPWSADPANVHDFWHTEILTTVFWIGEPAGGDAGPVCNRDCAWDMRWVERFGGADHPRQRNGFHPAGFTPKQNPFYIALPYNDLIGRAMDNPLIRPFLEFWKTTPRAHRSLCKNQWIQVRYGGRACFAQWEDVGPAYRDDFEYVFGAKAPRSHARGLAGLDVSPAVRDYLRFPGSGRADWKFVRPDEIPDGPWSEIVTSD
jgi:hypothetical protein